MLLTLLVIFLSVLPASASDESDVTTVLDAFHQAASEADGERYFSLFTDDAVFIGTDITERWTVEDFKAYALPFFRQGKGWTYTPQMRHVQFSSDGQTAWFDETLQSKNYGPTRGTGVLTKTAEGWKVAQYHLTVPVPNSLLKQVVEMIEKADTDN